jgi:DNA-binding IscR family transcriptional regulator
MAPLVRAGIVEAREGRDGGYRLARPLDRITLADLYRALSAVPTSEPHQSEPSWSALLPAGTRLALDEVAAEAEARLLQLLEQHTIASVAARAHALGSVHTAIAAGE